MKQNIINELSGKKILILGFGREGQSTYSFIQKNVKYSALGIADKNEIKLASDKPQNVFIHSGEGYLECLASYDIIIKTPGIPLKDIDLTGIEDRITSQTDLFIKYGRDKIIGVTGTKGKSTTSSLIYSMLRDAGKQVMLIGNIGLPAFESLYEEEKIEYFVYELSAHQLQYLHESPHISIFLNLYEEHLDHFGTFESYASAKLNILKFQKEGDFGIYGESIKEKVPKTKATMIEVGAEGKCIRNSVVLEDKKIIFNIQDVINNLTLPEGMQLSGMHNIYNSMVAATVANIYNIDEDSIKETLKTFKTLPHRLQNIGKYNNIEYIDDSISTIPEATIMAIETIKSVGTVIIGGMDRGIDYDILIDYIRNHNEITYILMYESGKRIYDAVKDKNNVKYVTSLEEAVNIAKEITKPNTACVLSPAAASYGPFKNFEERGERFKEYIIKD